MKSINEYRALVAVVEAGSIRGAAESSDLPRSTLSRAVQRLEERLDVDLFDRSGRGLDPSPAGELLYKRAREFLSDIAASEAAVKRVDDASDETLVISIPRTAGQPILVEAVSSFADAHTDLDLRVLATDRYVDLKADGVDVALRAGRIGKPDEIARRVGQVEWGLYAEESLDLEEAGDVWSHPLVLVTTQNDEVIWPFAVPLEEPARVRMRTTDFAVAASAVSRGVGVGALPTLHAAQKTRRVLPDVFSADVELCAFFQEESRERDAVQAFADHMAAHLGEPP
jgi:DNA-binding transcriptional LysR family regulator